MLARAQALEIKRRSAPGFKPYTYPPKSCYQCGSQFRPKHKHNVFCGRTCHNKSQYEPLRLARAAAREAAREAKAIGAAERRAVASRANASKTRTISCVRCKHPFVVNRIGKRYCSVECHRLEIAIKNRAKGTRHCQQCDALYTPTKKGFGSFCSDECTTLAKRLQRKASKAVRRYRLRISSQPVDEVLVFTIQQWTCQRCRCVTPVELRGTYDAAAPELDHIVALANGGSHTYNNVQTLCRRCNQAKGARLG